MASGKDLSASKGNTSAGGPSDAPLRVLLIEEQPEVARQVHDALAQLPERPFILEWVVRLNDGLARLHHKDVRVVLLGLGAAGREGLTAVPRLGLTAPSVPVVILSNTYDETAANWAVRLGVQDYLVWPETRAPLLGRALRLAIERQRQRSDLVGLLLLDPLTRLNNLRGLVMLAEKQFQIAARTGKPLSLFYLDLDGFKGLNDRYGHDAGDRALVEAADALRRSFRDADILARIGGDEFVALALETQEGAGDMILSRIHRHFAAANAAHPRATPLAFSAGWARYDPRKPCTLDELLSSADRHTYEIKREKKSSRVTLPAINHPLPDAGPQ
jgi:two-component system cell cycle response regulator